MKLGLEGIHDRKRPFKVVFVCWANVCRSRLLESAGKKWIRKNRAQGSIQVTSAGISIPAKNMVPGWRFRLLSWFRGYRLTRVQKQLSKLHLNSSDLIVVVDRLCLDSLKTIDPSPRSNVALLSDFLESDWPVDVPDPMVGTFEKCRRVISMIETALPRILQQSKPGAGIESANLVQAAD